METFGQRVRRIRTARKMSQAEVAAAAGMHRTDIIAVEKGRLSLGPTRLARIADALQVTVLELDDRAEPDERAHLLEDRLEELAVASDDVLANQKDALTTQEEMLAELRWIHEALDTLLGGAEGQSRRSGGRR